MRFCFTVIAEVGSCLDLIDLGAGKWLVREDPSTKCDGNCNPERYIPARALEAAKLYHGGYAKQIWVTHPDDRLKSQ